MRIEDMVSVVFGLGLAALFVCIEVILLIISAVEIANGSHDQSFINSMLIANWFFVFLHVAAEVRAIIVDEGYRKVKQNMIFKFQNLEFGRENVGLNM
eukprot:UN05837